MALHPPPNIRAVLFDFDGVLVDSEPLHYRCWMDVIKPYGAHMPWPEYNRRLTGKTDLIAAEILLTGAGKSPTPESKRQACDTKRAAFQARFREELTILPELQHWIRQSPRHLNIGVVSSSMTSEVEPLLIKTEIRRHLDILICGDHVLRHKPDPEPYLTALKRLNNGSSQPIKPQQCLVIEDSEAGIAAGTAAGMQVKPVKSTAEVMPALREALPTIAP